MWINLLKHRVRSMTYYITRPNVNAIRGIFSSIHGHGWSEIVTIDLEMTLTCAFFLETLWVYFLYKATTGKDDCNKKRKRNKKSAYTQQIDGPWLVDIDRRRELNQSLHTTWSRSNDLIGWMIQPWLISIRLLLWESKLWQRCMTNEYPYDIRFLVNLKIRQSCCGHI